MEVKHTHPTRSEEERLEQLRSIRKTCVRLIGCGRQKEKAD